MSFQNDIYVDGNPVKDRTGFFVCFFLSFIFAFTLGCINKKNQIGDRPVLQINDNRLSMKVFAEKLAFHLKDFDAITVKNEKVVQRVREQIVNDFIVETLTRQWAEKKEIFVNSEDLETEIKNIRSQYPDDLAFRRSLNEQGLSFYQWQEKIKYSLLTKKVFKEINKDLSPSTESEIKRYYETHKEEFQSQEKVHLRQIVLDSESNAKRIYEEIRKNHSIKELAQKFSIAPEAEKGGDLGWLTRGTLEIFDTAFNMRIGQKSEVLKSPYGYHIFEVLDKKKATIETLKSVEERIKRRLIEIKEQKNYSAWLEERVRSAKILKDEQLLLALTVETKDEL